MVKSSDTNMEVMAHYIKWGIQARLYLLKGTKNKSRLMNKSSDTDVEVMAQMT